VARRTKLVDAERRSTRTLRGDKIAMVFQDPNTSLHPLFTIGWQLAEVLQMHGKQSAREVRAACVRALATSASPIPSSASTRTRTSCRAARSSA